MKLDKAIEILVNTHKANYKFLDPDFREALKLGIEALGRLQHRRIVHPAGNKELLPGEDPE